MQYRIQVLAPEGTINEVVVDADNETEARQLVSNSGGRIIALRVASAPLFKRRHAFSLTVFNQQMFSLLEAGQTVVDAIDILGRNDRRVGARAVYDALLRELRQGNQLSEAMVRLPSVFPMLYVAMVRSSETTGTVRASIKRYMQYQRQVDEIRGKLTAAATYPAILLGVGSLVIVFLMLYVLPRFAAVYEDAGTMRNGSAGFVQWWGALVQENTLLAWGGVMATLVAMAVAVLHPAMRALAYRRLVATPWVGERIRVLQLSRLYRTLGMLLTSGVSILSAMRMSGDALPAAMRPSLDAAVHLVNEGVPLSRTMQQCSLSTEVAVRLLVAGESSGNLADMMGRVADFYDQETAYWIDTAGRLIEPVLMLGIGLVVGAIVLLLYSPIFDLANIV